MRLEKLRAKFESAVTPRDVRVGQAVAEVLDLSSEFTVDQVREAFMAVNGKPAQDGWLYTALDSLEAQGMIEPNFDADPILYTPTEAFRNTFVG